MLREHGLLTFNVSSCQLASVLTEPSLISGTPTLPSTATLPPTKARICVLTVLDSVTASVVWSVIVCEAELLRLSRICEPTDICVPRPAGMMLLAKPS